MKSTAPFQKRDFLQRTLPIARTLPTQHQKPLLIILSEPIHTPMTYRPPSLTAPITTALDNMWKNSSPVSSPLWKILKNKEKKQTYAISGTSEYKNIALAHLLIELFAVIRNEDPKNYY